MEPNANGPLAEIEFWRERNASFAALLEQLKRADVQHMLSVLAEAKNPVIGQGYMQSVNGYLPGANESDFHTVFKFCSSL